MTRHDGRADGDLRSVEIVPGFLEQPAGSALVKMGRTQVLCTASVEERVPGFLQGAGEGWVTAEYAMLPGATDTRSAREVARGRPSGRTMEIQRLIGRALRAVVDRKALGERTVWVDCDVLQADGGTRTASITGAFVALGLALDRLRSRKVLRRPALLDTVAAVSVGVVEDRTMLDLDYVEDSAAEVDMNVVRTGRGSYVEVQGTAESTPYDRARLNALLDQADAGIERLTVLQREVLGEAVARVVVER